MNKNGFVVKHSIVVNRPCEAVWDFTQDYDNRAKWDQAVTRAILVQSVPSRVVKLSMKGNTEMTFLYKLDHRPFKTTLVAKEIKSAIIESAGGSWAYEPNENGTLWTQTNSIVLKNGFWLRLLLPFFRWAFRFQTIKAMEKAKKMMETGMPLP